MNDHESDLQADRDAWKLLASENGIEIAALRRQTAEGQALWEKTDRERKEALAKVEALALDLEAERALREAAEAQSFAFARRAAEAEKAVAEMAKSAEMLGAIRAESKEIFRRTHAGVQAALEFYADAANYRVEGLPGGESVSKIEDDGGTRARASLEFSKRKPKAFQRSPCGRALFEMKREIEWIAAECRHTIGEISKAKLSRLRPDFVSQHPADPGEVIRHLSAIAELLEEAHDHVLALERGRGS
jgi:hypothetical protein